MSLTRRATMLNLLALASPAAAGAAQTDGMILETAFRALHPGLMRYVSPAALDRHFTALHRALGAAASPAETWLALTRFTAALRCGHTFVNGANQRGAGLAFLEEGRHRLPFAFRWLGGRMIVTEPANIPGLAMGDEILDLGGRPAGPLLSQLMALAAADGHNDAKRIRLAELDLRETWPLPDVALPLLAPEIFRGETLRLRVRRPDGRLASVVAPLLTRSERVAQRPPRTRDGAAWTSTLAAGGARILTMPTWALYDSRWDWRRWLDAEVDAAIDARSPGIVLDLRGNAGGQDCGDYLLERVIDRDVVPPDAQRFVRYRRTPPELDRYLDTWDRSFRNWGDDAHGPDARGFYRMTRWDGDDGRNALRPRGRRFTGRLVAMIDATNSSATFQFAQTVKAAGVGVLVGETTGGNRRGINGGGFFFLRLPQCGFEVDLPLVATFPSSPQPDGGVVPDVRVAPNAADIALGRDTVRETALPVALGEGSKERSR